MGLLLLMVIPMMHTCKLTTWTRAQLLHLEQQRLAHLHFLLQLQTLLVQCIVGSTAVGAEGVVLQLEVRQLLLQHGLLLCKALHILTPG